MWVVLIFFCVVRWSLLKLTPIHLSLNKVVQCSSPTLWSNYAPTIAQVLICTTYTWCGSNWRHFALSSQHKKICTQLKPLSLRRKCFCKDVDCWLWSYHDWKMYFSNHRGVFTNDRLANHSPNRVHTLQIHLCTTKIPRRCNPQIERYNHLINDRGFSINGMKAFFLHFFAA